MKKTRTMTGTQGTTMKVQVRLPETGSLSFGASGVAEAEGWLWVIKTETVVAVRGMSFATVVMRVDGVTVGGCVNAAKMGLRVMVGEGRE